MGIIAGATLGPCGAANGEVKREERSVSGGAVRNLILVPPTGCVCAVRQEDQQIGSDSNLAFIWFSPHGRPDDGTPY